VSGFRMARASLGQPARVPEKTVQAHIVQLLRSLGGKVFVLGTRRRGGDYPGTMQSEGVPDLLAFLPSRAEPGRQLFLVIECKARGGRLRPDQEIFRALCVSAGVVHITGDLDAVIAWLIDQGYLKRENVPHYRLPQEQP